MIARQWHHALIADDPRHDVSELSPDPLVVADDGTPAGFANPVALIQGFRYLQQRIPGFTKLSAEARLPEPERKRRKAGEPDEGEK
jgi:hypothetical protein